MVKPFLAVLCFKQQARNKILLMENIVSDESIKEIKAIIKIDVAEEMPLTRYELQII